MLTNMHSWHCRSVDTIALFKGIATHLEIQDCVWKTSTTVRNFNDSFYFHILVYVGKREFFFQISFQYYDIDKECIEILLAKTEMV